MAPIKMNAEFRKVVKKVKAAQSQLQGLIQDTAWVDDAKKYAERQRKEVKKLITSDIDKVRTFIEKERKELDRFQKQIPSEVKKFRKFVTGQRKELEKLLTQLRKTKAPVAAVKAKAKSAVKKTTRRKAAPTTS